MKEIPIKNDPQLAGYQYLYLKDNNLKVRLIPIELKDLIIEKFGSDIVHIDEETLDNFIIKNK